MIASVRSFQLSVVLFSLLSCFVLGLAACVPMEKTPTQQQSEVTIPSTDNPPDKPTLVSPACCGKRDARLKAEEAERLAKASISQRTIHFEYDQYRFSDAYTPIVEAHARYLIGHPAVVLQIAGSTDERGSSEYNLALGQKRSEYVKRVLAMYGVPVQRVEVISYGADKSVAVGSDEASWKQNRRVDLTYIGE